MQPDRAIQANLLPLGAAIALVTTAFCLGLGNHGPIPSMETRFAVAVQQMLAHHQWLIPEKNGLPYIEYPPFYYWLAMLGAKAGLPLLPAVRLPNLLALWVWIAAAYGLGRRLLVGLPPWLLPVAVLVSPAVLYNFFIAQADGWLASGIALAILGYAQLDERRRFPWLMWTGMAIAVFAKGPVGLVLPLLVIAFDRLITAGTRQESWSSLPRTAIRLAPVRGISLALAPLAAWYVACGLLVSWEFVRASFIYDNFTRYLAGAGGHHNPWWLYAQSIWGDYFPWSLALPFGMVLAARRVREAGPRLALAWTIATLIFFSASASKQSKYILPAAPAFVALTLLALARLTQNRHRWLKRTTFGWAAFVLIAFTVLVGAWLPFLGPRIDDDAGYSRLRGFVAANPGALYMYRWPRSLVLYQLGAPMPWFRDARGVYRAVHDGHLRPGDYLLVPDSNLKADGAHGLYSFLPAPGPPYFKHVMKIPSKGGIEVYRVLPGAAAAPLPTTPKPPPAPWWARFDTD